MEDFEPLLANLEALDVGGNRSLSMESVSRLMSLERYRRLESRLRAEVSEERSTPVEGCVAQLDNSDQDDEDCSDSHSEDGVEYDEAESHVEVPENNASSSFEFVSWDEFVRSESKDDEAEVRPFKPVPFPAKIIPERVAFPAAFEGQFDDATESCDENPEFRETAPPPMLSLPTLVPNVRWSDRFVSGQFSDTEEEICDLKKCQKRA